MATRYPGHVVQFTLATSGLSADEDVLHETLAGMDSLAAYRFDPATRLLTVYFEATDAHEEIVRALMASGLFLISGMRIPEGMGGDSRAC